MVYREYNFFSNNSVSQKDVSFPVRGTPYVAAFKIHSVTVPLGFNTTDSSNYVVIFERSGSTKTATVSPGNYTAATFPQALQNAMNDMSAVKDYVVSFDEVTRRVTITASSTFTIHPFNRGTTAYKQLGLGKFSTSVSGATVVLGISDFTSTAALLLTSSHLNSKDMVYSGEENINVLAKINTNSPQRSVAK